MINQLCVGVHFDKFRCVFVLGTFKIIYDVHLITECSDVWVDSSKSTIVSLVRFAVLCVVDIAYICNVQLSFCAVDKCDLCN